MILIICLKRNIKLFDYIKIFKHELYCFCIEDNIEQDSKEKPSLNRSSSRTEVHKIVNWWVGLGFMLCFKGAQNLHLHKYVTFLFVQVILCSFKSIQY